MPDERPIKTVSLVDPFTHYDPKVAGKVLDPAVETYNLRPILGVELDKETGNTKIVETGVEDIDKIIQEYKDDCGFEGMKKLIDAGQARAIDYMDDGKHGMDIVGLPDNVNDAYRAAMASKNTSNDALAKLGVKPVYNVDGSLNMEATEKAISDAVTKIFTDKIKEAEDAKKEIAGEKKDETK